MTAYDRIAELEVNLLNRTFLPYSIGTPSREMLDANPYPRANLVFFTDSHVDFENPEESLDNVRRTVDYINHAPVRFNAIIHGGDIITPFGTTPKAEAYARADNFFELARQSKVPFLFAKGNHDLNDWGNLPENVLNDEDFGSLFLDYAEKTYGIHRQTKNNGKKSTWQYYDIEAQKIRVVAVDVQDVDKTLIDENGLVRLYGGVAWGISQEQMRWIADTALNFDDKDETDWGVIFFMHMGLKYGTFLEIPYENSIVKLLDLCVSFQHQGNYASTFVHPDYPSLNFRVTADFTRYQVKEKKPHIICWLLGHEHTDSFETVKGIPILMTANGSCTEVSSDERLVRLPETSTQNCFDILNIDTRERRIRLFRYGAGVTCYGIGGHRFLPDGLAY